jgi:chlorite dismutase
MYWGLTRPSDYSKGKSSQEIDPFSSEHKQYLVVYPFTKTAEWYRLSRDARQGMMNEHIRTGRQYPQISQLLLYSTGLQDQEFIVAYETDELGLFSGLVTELRTGDARIYTLSDTPIYTGIYHSTRDTLNLFV